MDADVPFQVRTGVTLIVVEPPLPPSAPRPETPVRALTTSDTKETRSTPRRKGTAMTRWVPF